MQEKLTPRKAVRGGPVKVDNDDDEDDDNSQAEGEEVNDSAWD